MGGVTGTGLTVEESWVGWEEEVDVKVVSGLLIRLKKSCTAILAIESEKLGAVMGVGEAVAATFSWEASFFFFSLGVLPLARTGEEVSGEKDTRSVVFSFFALCCGAEDFFKAPLFFPFGPDVESAEEGLSCIP